MRSCDLRLLAIIMGISFLVSLGQNSVTERPLVSPPENIQLLDGYKWVSRVSKDATVGSISNPSGFSILFDQSAVKGFYKREYLSEKDLIWSKSQIVNGQSLDVALLKNGEIIGLFDYTTRFSAKPGSTSEIADFFLTVMTFGSGTDKALDSPKSLTPGNIQLPNGFVHETRRGKDSKGGAIVRSDGFTVNYDIGRMAGNYADQYFPENFERLRKQTHLNTNAIERQIKYLQDQIQWRQRQKVNGQDVMVVLLKNNRLIAAFPDSNANFVAEVDSSDKIADFFLIVLTYIHPKVTANATQKQRTPPASSPATADCSTGSTASCSEHRYCITSRNFTFLKEFYDGARS